MQSELDEYAAFYSEKHQGHKIEWSHALGTVSMRAHFAAGQKELSVSLYQAVVLLLFNDMAEIPFSDVKLCTGIGMSTSSNCMSTSYTFPHRACCFPLLFHPFMQRMLCCDARFKAWLAGRKECSRNALLEKTWMTRTSSYLTTRSRIRAQRCTSTLSK